MHVYNTTRSICYISYTLYRVYAVQYIVKIMYSQHVQLHDEGNILKVINYIFSINIVCLRTDGVDTRLYYIHIYRYSIDNS